MRSWDFTAETAARSTHGEHTGGGQAETAWVYTPENTAHPRVRNTWQRAGCGDRVWRKYQSENTVLNCTNGETAEGRETGGSSRGREDQREEERERWRGCISYTAKPERGRMLILPLSFAVWHLYQHRKTNKKNTKLHAKTGSKTERRDILSQFHYVREKVPLKRTLKAAWKSPAQQSHSRASRRIIHWSHLTSSWWRSLPQGGWLRKVTLPKNNTETFSSPKLS